MKMLFVRPEGYPKHSVRTLPIQEASMLIKADMDDTWNPAKLPRIMNELMQGRCVMPVFDRKHGRPQGVKIGEGRTRITALARLGVSHVEVLWPPP